MRPYRSSFYPTSTTSPIPPLRTLHDVSIASPDKLLRDRLQSLIMVGTAGCMEVYGDRLVFKNSQSSTTQTHKPSTPTTTPTGIYILLKDILHIQNQQGGWFTNSTLTLSFRDLPKEHVITLQFRIEKDMEFVIQTIESALKEYKLSKKRNRLESLEPRPKFRLRHERSKRYLALNAGSNTVVLMHQNMALQEELSEWRYADGMIFSAMSHLSNKVLEYNFQQEQFQLGENKYHTGSNKHQLWRLVDGVMHLWTDTKALNANENEDGVVLVSLSAGDEEGHQWSIEVSGENLTPIDTRRSVAGTLPPELRSDVPLYDSSLKSASMRDGDELDNSTPGDDIPTKNRLRSNSGSTTPSSSKPRLTTQNSSSSITQQEHIISPSTPASSIASTPQSPNNSTPLSPTSQQSRRKRKAGHKSSRHSRQTSDSAQTPIDTFTSSVHFSDLTQERDNLKSENESLHAKITSLQKKLRYSHKHIDHLKKDHESQVEKLTQEHIIDMDTLRARLEQYRAQSAQASQSTSEQSDQLMEQLSEANQTIANLKKKMMTRESQAKNLRHSNQELEKKVTSQRASLDQLNVELSTVKQQLSESQMQLSQLQRYYEKTAKQLEEYKKTVAQVSPKMQSLEENLQRSQTELTITTEKLTHALVDANMHKTLSEQQRFELQSLHSELSTSRSEARVRQMRSDCATQTETPAHMLEHNTLQQQLYQERQAMNHERQVMLQEKNILIKEERSLLAQQTKLGLPSFSSRVQPLRIQQVEKQLAQCEQELQKQKSLFSQKESQLFLDMDTVEKDNRQCKLQILDLKEKSQSLEAQLKRALTDFDAMRNRLLDREKELEIARANSVDALRNIDMDGASAELAKMRKQVELDRRDVQKEREEIYRTQDNLRKEMYELQERYNQFDLHKRTFQVESKEAIMKDKRALQEREDELAARQERLEKRQADLQHQWELIQQEREEMQLQQQELHDKQAHLLEREELVVKNMEAISRGETVFTSEKMQQAYAKLQQMEAQIVDAQKHHDQLTADLESRIQAHTQYVEEIEQELTKRKLDLQEEYDAFEENKRNFQAEQDSYHETIQNVLYRESTLDERERDLMRKIRNEENAKRKKLHADRIKLNEDIAKFQVEKESHAKWLEDEQRRLTIHSDNIRAEIRQLQQIKLDHEREIEANKQTIVDQQRQLGLLTEEAAQEQRALEQRLAAWQSELEHEKFILARDRDVFEKERQERDSQLAIELEALQQEKSQLVQVDGTQRAQMEAERQTLEEERRQFCKEVAGMQVERDNIKEKQAEFEERTQLLVQWENKLISLEKQLADKEANINAYLQRERRDAQVETTDCELDRGLNQKLDHMKQLYREKMEQQEEVLRQSQLKHAQLLRQLDEESRQLSEREHALNEAKKSFNINLRELTARQQDLSMMEREFEEQRQLMTHTREVYDRERIALQQEKEQLAIAVEESTHLLMDLKRKEQDLDSRTELIAIREEDLAKKQRFVLYAEEHNINTIEEHMRQLQLEYEAKAAHNRQVHDRDSVVSLQMEKENFYERVQMLNHAHELDLEILRKQLNRLNERNQQLEGQHAQLEYIVGKLIPNISSEHEHYAELSAFLRKSEGVSEHKTRSSPAVTKLPLQQAPAIPSLNLNALSAENQQKSSRSSKSVRAQKSARSSGRDALSSARQSHDTMYSPRISVHSRGSGRAAQHASENGPSNTQLNSPGRLLTSHQMSRDSNIRRIPQGDIMSITLKSTPDVKWSVSIQDEGVLSILQIDSVEEENVEKHRYVFLAENVGRTVLKLLKETVGGNKLQELQIEVAPKQ